MPVMNMHTDPETLTLTMTSEFDATQEQVWELWANPRKLERWWGPPTYPATVVDHDLTAGGRVRYYMTGPEGDRHHGLWQIVAVDAPSSLEFEDSFCDESGVLNEELPTTTARVAIGPAASGRTQMTITSVFDSVDHMEQLVEMGMVEGLTQSVNQIDALLAERAAVS